MSTRFVVLLRLSFMPEFAHNESTAARIIETKTVALLDFFTIFSAYVKISVPGERFSRLSSSHFSSNICNW